MKWKVITSEYLFKDLWFKVRRERCQTPQGKIIDPYYVYDFPNWVTVVPITEDGKIIMIKQYRHALGEVCLEIPGGCIDDTDADSKTAALRELKEETGYEFDQIEYLGKTSANPSTNSNIMYMYVAKGGKKKYEQQLDHNEEIEMELWTIDEVKQALRDNKIMQSMHITCLLYAFEKLGVPGMG